MLCRIASIELLSCIAKVVSDSFVTPWTIACKVPLSMQFPRHEYCNGLPFPSPGDLPDPGIEPVNPSPALSVLCLVTQSCPTLCNSGSSVHGVSPDKNTGVGCHALLHGIFPVQGSNPGFLHSRFFAI